VILFCDEDVGTSVPSALRGVGLPALWTHKLNWRGKTDVDWLTIVGRKGWLVLSYNKKMLLVPDERQVIIDRKLGIVFLTKQLPPPTLLRLLLQKWRALEVIDATPRPFAYFLSPNGRVSSRHRHFKL
jgi:hypothetical protein